MPNTAMHKVVTDWSGTNSPGGQSVMFFDSLSVASVAALRADVADFWTGVDGVLNVGTHWEVQSEVLSIDPTDGSLVAAESDPTPHVGNGEGGGDPVANAAQMLLRWETGQIVSGRRLRGRTFVPGLNGVQTDEGEISNSCIAAVSPLLATFLTNAPLVVWHRPGPGGPGSWEAATSGSVWTELAILRHRR